VAANGHAIGFDHQITAAGGDGGEFHAQNFGAGKTGLDHQRVVELRLGAAVQPAAQFPGRGLSRLQRLVTQIQNPGFRLFAAHGDAGLEAPQGGRRGSRGDSKQAEQNEPLRERSMQTRPPDEPRE
jgi:hypothetical protein